MEGKVEMTRADARRAREIISREEAVEHAKEDLKAAYDAAESVGFTKKALRAAIKIHRLNADKRQKHDAGQLDLELYLATIEGRRAAE